MPETSKHPPMGICSRCEEWRQVHQRKPVILCTNCYIAEHPPKRETNFCKRCYEWKTICGRGLCRTCYDYCRYHDEIETYPTR